MTLFFSGCQFEVLGRLRFFLGIDDSNRGALDTLVPEDAGQLDVLASRWLRWRANFFALGRLVGEVKCVSLRDHPEAIVRRKQLMAAGDEQAKCEGCKSPSGAENAHI